jgi:hypothetical protein
VTKISSFTEANINSNTFIPMKRITPLLLFLILGLQINGILVAQSSPADRIKEIVPQSQVEFDIYFLAADEFLGRDTGTNELDIAARYISTWFQTNGVITAPGYDSYFQNVPFQRFYPPVEASFAAGDSVFALNRDFVAMNSERGEFDAEVIYLEHASREELEEADVEGKIVVAAAGLPGQTSPQQLFSTSQQKIEWASEAGAAGLVELFTNPQFPWQFLVNFLGGERIAVMNEETEERGSIPHLWINSARHNLKPHFASVSGETVSLTLKGPQPEKFYSRNVIGVIEGTDNALKDEYILLSAHYDHIGVVDNHPEPITSEYIYNGARDNAVGTAGVLAAARYFSKHPPKRSVIFAAWTAEERGLLGSAYFANNPMIPLEQIVYNLNIDGAGYNDTTKVTVIGLGRTEADDEMIAAAAAFNLKAIPDPVPEQNLFDRSDNVNFARHGIPAPTYSMGLTAFDEEINYYYHQVTDEPHTLNYDYITAYIRSFVLAAQKIADRDEAPFWLPGDVYEEAGIELYGKGE